MANTTSQVPAQKASPVDINNACRSILLKQAVPMDQQISSLLYATVPNGPQTVVPRNVGIIKKFTLEVNFTVNNTDGANTLTLSDFGLANLFSQLTYTDFQNNVRVQTTGWHLFNLWIAKHKELFGIIKPVLTANAFGGYGDNFSCVLSPATIGHGASAACRFFIELPLAYSEDDMRGAVWANVVNANSQLTYTINPAAIVDVGADSSEAVYFGAEGNISNISVTVYQEYLDQLPQDQNGNVILPQMDLATIYDIKNTSLGPVMAGNDFAIPYRNLCDFLSTIVIFNHDTSANAGRVGGGDVNSWALRSANSTNLWLRDPIYCAMKARNLLGLDLPKGMYYFSSRRQPIDTTQYGNMQLVLNASSAAATNSVKVGWEAFTTMNVIKQASSLA